MNKKIIFFSNPFGFGPTGKIHALIHEFRKQTGCDLIYATDALCSEIIETDDIKTVQLNTRDFGSVKSALAEFPEAHVVSSLNRFAIRAAHEMGIKNALVDGLFWLWSAVPDGFLLADNYFALDFLGVEDAIKNFPKVERVPYISDSVGGPVNKDECAQDIIQLGGCLNPHVSGLPTPFLDFVSLFLSRYGRPALITGGSEALGYLSSKSKRTTQAFVTLKRGEYLKRLFSTNAFITCPGLTSTIEAFSRGVATSFLPPQNLSQFRILSLLKKHDIVSGVFSWTKYVPSAQMERASEADSIKIINAAAAEVMKHPETRKRATDDLFQQIDSPPNVEAQTKLVHQIGANGAEVIVSRLVQRWGLNNG